MTYDFPVACERSLGDVVGYGTAALGLHDSNPSVGHRTLGSREACFSRGETRGITNPTLGRFV